MNNEMMKDGKDTTNMKIRVAFDLDIKMSMMDGNYVAYNLDFDIAARGESEKIAIRDLVGILLSDEDLVDELTDTGFIAIEKIDKESTITGCPKCNDNEIKSKYYNEGDLVDSSSTNKVDNEFIRSSEYEYFFKLTANTAHTSFCCKGCGYNWQSKN